MARAESASASAHSNSIKGLAQAVARPAYRRLLTAEPFLRRAVPVLIVAFLRHARRCGIRRHARAAAPGDRQIGRRARPGRDASWPSASTGWRRMNPAIRWCARFRAFERIDWPRATAAGRMVLLTDASSTIIATQPALNGYIGRKLNEAIGRDPRVPGRHDPARRVRTHARRRIDASCSRCATSTAPLGQLAITQRRARRARPNGAPTPRSPSRCSRRPASWC